ncbi:MAG TPA: lipopolysaccharide assembly protein LapB [Gammaproteobacteria bacterium]|nr:lipopolysaccharide assembly protein LapB [Gammaproteobacteria bacterium]
MYELLWLLLPAAAASGWFLAKQDVRRKGTNSATPPPSSAYYKGLNYLLNEQPDKAIEVFVRMLEVDGETVEIHLALGSLFRERGEVDRAIRIHQNIFERQNLTPEQRAEALFELGKDNLRAGLFDRAETLFCDLCDVKQYRRSALTLLLDIYQQEKEWGRAIDTARRLQKESGKPQRTRIAHYYCELAEQALADGHAGHALDYLDKALSTDANCVRASLSQGRLMLAAENADPGRALQIFQGIEKQNPAYLSEAIPAIVDCYRRMGEEERLCRYLQGLFERYGGVTTLVALAESIQHIHGSAAALDCLRNHLRQQPSLRGLQHLLSLEQFDPAHNLGRTLSVAQNTLQRLFLEKAVYQCDQCGFMGKSLYWQCPGCKHWNSVRPIRGLEGE